VVALIVFEGAKFVVWLSAITVIQGSQRKTKYLHGNNLLTHIT
jgi:hypothetical protein